MVIKDRNKSMRNGIHFANNKKKTSFQTASVWAHRDQEPIDEQLNAQGKYKIVRNFVWLRKNGIFFTLHCFLVEWKQR